MEADKWDEICNRIRQGILAEEPDAVFAAGLQLFAEFGRTLEMVSADMDRIATALEAKDPETVSGAPAVLDL